MPPVRHVYREGGGAGVYECRLHSVPCFARPLTGGGTCDVATFLHPLCPRHARDRLGLEVRRSTLPGAGCGLYTTRNLQKGDLIAPFLGMRRPANDARCRHATRPGPGPRTGSPYGIDLDPEWMRDASCLRSYASMVNHHPNQRRRNCGFHLLKLESNRHFVGGPDPVEPRHRSLVDVPGYRSAPNVLRQATRGAGGLDQSMVWLVATKRIKAGSELFADYGTQAAAGVVGFSHSTTPDLC